MTNPNTFRILYSYREKKQDGWLTNIPWDFISSHEEQAQINHGQSLKRLNERGGLGLSELYCVLTDTEWDTSGLKISNQDWMDMIINLLEDWERKEINDT